MKLCRGSVFLAGGTVTLILFWVTGPRIAINTSPSLPEGLYLIQGKEPSDISKGDIILFWDKRINPWAAQRGYIREGEPIGKRVVAVEGDLISINQNKTKVLGQLVSEHTPVKDSKGRMMKLFHFEGEVPKDHVFLIGDTHNSFDSRYYGFIHKKCITATVRPLIVW